MRKWEDLVDTYLHKGLRKKLVEILKEKGITDVKVLEAIHAIPRHYFLDSAFDKIAYEDRAFPIAADQTISQPYTVAYQTQLLQIKKGEKVLEIGTGSMYQTTVLAAMGAQVFTIERQKQLFEQTPTFVFKEQYPNIQFFFGDGFEGLPSLAPFDKILIKMIIPLDETDAAQRMLRLTKKRDGSVKQEKFDTFSFVPMLEGKTQK